MEEQDMLDLNRRRLPVGIQSFKKIREGNFVYVDKSDLVWYLVNYGDQYNYLSRPRRFGKSVLVDTLQHYLEGNKELFEGLKIMELEKEWKHHPVIRLQRVQPIFRLQDFPHIQVQKYMFFLHPAQELPSGDESRQEPSRLQQSS